MAVLKISGDKVRDYLQGQITQDINLLTPNHPIYTAVLTPQGKMIADMYMLDCADELILLTQATHAASLIDRLKRFSMGYQLRMGLVPSLAVISIQGENSLAIGEQSLTHIEACMPMHEASPKGFWFIIESSHIPQILSKLPHVCSEQVMDDACTIFGMPKFMRDWDESIHPLNANLIDMQGVSFDKGCYTGQEVTSRMHWRGGIKKKLYHVKIHGDVPSTPCPIQTTINMGQLTAAATDENNQHFGIAHLPIETVEKQTPLSLENGSILSILKACHV